MRRRALSFLVAFFLQVVFFLSFEMKYIARMCVAVLGSSLRWLCFRGEGRVAGFRV